MNSGAIVFVQVLFMRNSFEHRHGSINEVYCMFAIVLLLMCVLVGLGVYNMFGRISEQGVHYGLSMPTWFS